MTGTGTATNLNGAGAVGFGSLWEARAAKRRRYRRVASALAAHGLSALAAGLNLNLPFFSRFRQTQDGHRRTTAEALRLAIEEIGTTAIKLGQVLSSRPDLVPDQLALELEKLRDKVPPVPTADIIAVIEQELGRPLSEIFPTFDPVPLASASIGQVHAATLRDGTSVVVKVRKPALVAEINADLAILADLARRAARARLFGKTYDVEALAAEFSWTLLAELDYEREGRNADRIREALAGDPRVAIPRVHWDISTSAVLVMERLDGVPIAEFMRSETATAADRRALAATSAETLMRQVFEAGFFHADPHPGNFLVLRDGRLGIVDFGMTGQLSEDTRDALFRLMAAIVERDGDAIADCLDDLGVVRSTSDRESVRHDAERLLERYYGVPVDRFRLADYIGDVLDIVRRRQLQLPTDLALVLKTVAMSEGLWRQLDPSFNAAAVAEPFVRNAAWRRYSPKNLGGRAFRASRETLELGAELPGQLRRVARRLDRGDFEIALRHQDIEETVKKLGDMVTRLSMAIVAAAFALGLPVLATVWKPPGWDYIAPAWFAIAVILTVFLLVRVALAGWFSGRS